MRTLPAFLLAPILPALVPAWFYHASGNRPIVSTVIFFCGLFYLLEAVLGIPGYIIFKRNSLHRIWAYALLGFFGLALPALILML